LGPLVINGPATANYDEDLGALFLQDWSHSSAFKRYALIGDGAPPALENGLINGTNAYTCPTTTDPNCLGNGTNFETTFVYGTKYRIRLVNTAIDGWIRFAIDDHNFTVIANDFVPITPFATDNLVIGIGQRYDIIVDATAGSGDYWMRAIWQSCSANLNGQKILGIVRYNESSTTVPTTTEGSFSTSCGDVPSSSLVPALPLNPRNLTLHDTLTVTLNQSAGNWLIDDHSLFLNWSNPTTLRVYNNETIFPADYNVFPLAVADEWVYMIIQTTLGINHPIHLHGHDFMILAQGTGTYVDGTTALNLVNPTRRDVAWLPGGGYLVIGWQTDNPGSWLMHCHIAWHASQGLAVQFIERESEISATILNPTAYMEMCSAWETFAATMPDAQDDSGI
jgi:FtsP/CotA-like multicopper oxidase with cupredoxin domain